MSKTHITFGRNTLWVADDPAAVWFRIMSLNLDIEEFPSGLTASETQDLCEALLIQSKFYGVSNVMGISLDEYLCTEAAIRYFKAVTTEVNRIVSAFGEYLDSKTLRALGFSGQLATDITADEIVSVGEGVLSMLP